MFIERRNGERRSLSDLRSWDERRRPERRRPEWRRDVHRDVHRGFLSEIDEDRRSGNDQRQDTRRIEIRRLGQDRRSWEFCEETCYS